MKEEGERMPVGTPTELRLCPRWQAHDDDPGVCPVCNGRGVVLPDGSPVPDDWELYLSSFRPEGVVEEDSPTTPITITPTEGKTFESP